MIHRCAEGDVILNKEGVVGTMLTSGNGCEYVHLSIKPGSVVHAHSLPFPVTFYVLTGTGTLQTGEDRHEVTEGDLAEVGGGALRGWRNEGNKVLSLLVIKHVSSSVPADTGADEAGR
jgi:quercetin dioxygenase-like cupin family protein